MKKINMKKIKWMLCLLLMFAVCAGSAGAEGLSVLCTSFPCYDFVRAVLGSGEPVRMLMKPGAEVHTYEPTPTDIMALSDCDLFVYIGGESDAWVLDILSSFGEDAPRTLRLIDCVEAIEAEHDHDDHHETELDEHIWTSPVNAQRMVQAVVEALCEIDPDNAEVYVENGSVYISEITQIDAEIREIVANGVRNELIFADRFPFIYLTREYGLDYAAAFSSCSSESEPSAKTMAELIQRVAADKIPVVYTIELSSGKTAQTISEETGAEILTLQSIQTLSEADFTAGETYVSLMQRNVEALRKGLN